MKMLQKPCGDLMTNCYIVQEDGKEIIIDPGIGATEWVLQNVSHPVAILNTHGHYDHVWSNAALKEKLNVPLVTPKGDLMLVTQDMFGTGMPTSQPDILVEGDQELEFGGLKVKYIHFPGHTPGCSVIVIGERMFSGDFIFKGTIGRYDFPYSSAEEMRASVQKFMQIPFDMPVYPGHDISTTIAREQANLKRIRV